MSLSKLWKGVRSIAAPIIGGALGGPAGAALGQLLGGGGNKSVGQVPAAPMPLSGFQGSMPGAGFGGTLTRTAGPAMLMPLLGGGARALAPALGFGAGMALRGARTAARSAMAYCKRHPAWCASIGGLAAVEGLVSGGQLPPVKRRRARGITGRELSSFKRVSRVLNNWCKVPAPTQRARRKC